MFSMSHFVQQSKHDVQKWRMNEWDWKIKSGEKREAVITVHDIQALSFSKKVFGLIKAQFLYIDLHPTQQMSMNLGRKEHQIITTVVDRLRTHASLMRTDVVHIPTRLFASRFSFLSQPNKVVILSHFLLSNVVTSTEWWSAKCTQGRQFWGWDCQCLGDQSNLQKAHTHQTSQYNVLPSNPRPGVLAQTEKKSNPWSIFFSYISS